MTSPRPTPLSRRRSAPALATAFATPLAMALCLASLPALADDYILDTTLANDSRCEDVKGNNLTVRPPRSQSYPGHVVWRTGEASLEIGEFVQFSAWGNFDLAKRITLTGIPGAVLEIQDRQNGIANAARGCGGRGSVNLRIQAPKQPSVAVTGRLRFEFPVGGPFDIPVVLQPVPVGIDLRWPSQPASGLRKGEHDDCLRANGGHVKVDGDTLEIGLNPDGPMPQGCNVFALEGFDLRDTRDVTSSTSFSGSGNDRNLAITRVQGLTASQAFAQGRSERIQNFSALLRTPQPTAGAPFAAMQVDYAAAARALRARPALASSIQLAPASARPSGPNTAGLTRFGAPVPTPSAPAPAPARSIEFLLAIDSINNVSGLHGPMRVRLVETAQAAASNLVAGFDIDKVCSDVNAVFIRDRSTGGLAITRRELRSSDGQSFSFGGAPMTQRITFRTPGVYTITLTVTDASGATRTVENRTSIPRQPCDLSVPSPGGITVDNGGNQPNVLPARMFPERPLLRRVGGLGDRIMVPITFCAGLGNNERREVPVPDLTWGASSAQAESASVRVELRDANSNAVLSRFDTGALSANSAPVTRANYPGRPTRLRVANVTGDDVMVAYGNQTGCFLDQDAPAQRLDPEAISVVVDTLDVVSEGPDANVAEGDNELRF